MPPKKGALQPLTKDERLVKDKVVASGKARGVTRDYLQHAIPGLTPAKLTDTINELLRKKHIKSSKNASGEPVFMVLESAEAAARSSLTQEQQQALNLIDRAGRKGISRALISQQFGEINKAVLTKILEALEKAKLIKQFLGIAAPTTPLYILSNLEPSEAVAGGVWFDDSKDYDVGLVEGVTQALYGEVYRKTFPKPPKEDSAERRIIPNPIYPVSRLAQLPTPSTLLRFLRDSKVSTAEFSIRNVMEVMRGLELEGKVESVRPVGGVELDEGGASDEDDDSDDDDGGRRKKARRADDSASGSEDESEAERRRAKRKDKQRTLDRARREARKEKERAAKEKKRKEKEKRDKGKRRREKKRKEKKERKEKERKEADKARRKKRKAVPDSDDDSDAPLVDINDEPKSKSKSKSGRKRKYDTTPDSDDSDSAAASETESESEPSSDSGSASSALSSDDDDATTDSDAIDERAPRRKPKSTAAAAALAAAGLAAAASAAAPDMLDLSDPRVAYRATRRLHVPLGQAEGPCGQCPQFTFCEPDGPVNPTDCEYWADYLAGERGGWSADYRHKIERANAKRKEERERRAREAAEAERMAANGDEAGEAEGEPGAADVGADGYDGAEDGDAGGYWGDDGQWHDTGMQVDA